MLRLQGVGEETAEGHRAGDAHGCPGVSDLPDGPGLAGFSPPLGPGASLCCLQKTASTIFFMLKTVLLRNVFLELVCLSQSPARVGLDVQPPDA